jgi:hypothetical protein
MIEKKRENKRENKSCKLIYFFIKLIFCKTYFVRKKDK